jgi:hypothetical protein
MRLFAALGDARGNDIMKSRPAFRLPPEIDDAQVLRIAAAFLRDPILQRIVLALAPKNVPKTGVRSSGEAHDPSPPK